MLVVPIVLIILIAGVTLDFVADSYEGQILIFQEKFLNGSTKEFEQGLETMLTGMKMSIISAILTIFLAAILVIVLINTFLSARLTKSIIVPLRLLSAGSKKIRDGNLDFELRYNGKDEFEQVCSDFDEMRQRLKDSVEMQLKYEKDKQELIAGISHDLRTPLTVIKGYVEGLRDGVANTPEKQQKYLEMIYSKACDMDLLVDNLFLFSKMDTNHYPFQFQNTDISLYFNEFFSQAKSEFLPRGLDITFESKNGSIYIDLDHREMSRVLTNILENSVKYKTAKTGKVKAVLTQENSSAVITIADDGPGMEADDLPKIFKRFYRGDPSRTNPHEGSGLGLAIAKHIVNAHGGTIEARNNSGLEITITLPVEKRKENETNIDN